MIDTLSDPGAWADALRHSVNITQLPSGARGGVGNKPALPPSVMSFANFIAFEQAFPEFIAILHPERVG